MLELAFYVGSINLYILLNVINPWEIFIGYRLNIIVFNAVSNGYCP